ncbi:MAG: ABC transporter substrate-binding protein [Oscillospiraceae bacterium]|nr:ABC transporter substrate-binding protein [Oscillospiraceae bacterium]
MKLKFKAAAALFLALAMTGCANDHYTKDGGEITTSVIQEIPPEETVTVTAEVTDIIPVTESTEETSSVPLMITDREGSDIFIPDEVNTIVSLSPIVTELLTGLGVSDRIIAADSGSAAVEGADPAVCILSKSTITAEQLASLGADVVITGGTSSAADNAQLVLLRDMGVKVLFIPYSNSFSSIKLDIEFLAAYTGTAAKGKELVTEIDKALLLNQASSPSAAAKTVYIETSPAPSMQTAGSGTLFGDILTLIGAGNIYASQAGYIAADSAAVIEANPDVIISNVHTADYDVNEISRRQGWNGIKAVADGRVYRTSSPIRPTHKIIEYIEDVRKLVYPELYAETASSPAE